MCISLTFEDFKNQNGITFWWASELMLMLGYTDLKLFRKVIDRATKALISLNIDHFENIIFKEHEVDGEVIPDFKLTRFACYLVSMNADPKKKEVAYIQAYFAEQTLKSELYMEGQKDASRILKSEYNNHILESMDRAELAAKLFSITQTEERIKSRNIQGRAALEQTYLSVERSIQEILKKSK